MRLRGESSPLDSGVQALESENLHHPNIHTCVSYGGTQSSVSGTVHEKAIVGTVHKSTLINICLGLCDCHF